jgi:protoheme ferro-lyase
MTYKNGTAKEVGVKGIKRTKRVSTPLDRDKAMALITELGLVSECTEVVVELDEDKILAANYRGQISDEQLASLYDEKITYAFDLIRE